ncbi:MAG: Tyrosine-protein kinase ptk, partial [Phycisphaerales bacterium]|nr:Tyrosine-protein kinase ptk [Phycisphaerales bacterium]
MYNLLRHDGNGHGHNGSALDAPTASASLLEVLWRRRLTLGLTMLVCVAIAGIYLLFATRIYSATARVVVQQNGPKALAEAQGNSALSDSFIQTQADMLQSTPVLSRALEAVHYDKLKTFSKVPGDPVAWMQHGSALKVDVARKSDVISISMESPYPDEAAAIANSIVSAFVAEQALLKQTTGKEMVRALQNESKALKAKRQACLASMQKYRNESGVISFGSDKANTALERTATLATSLTAAEMASIELRAQFAATQAALANPASLSAFVEAQQFKTKDTGDHEFDDLRNQKTLYLSELSKSAAYQGANNTRVQALQGMIAAINGRIAEKERQIAQAHLISVQTELTAAEHKERDLRDALKLQTAQILAISPQAAEYTTLEAEAARLQKQAELLDGRIAEVNVNDIDAGSSNVQPFESARIEAKPIKPNKLLTLGAAIMVGWVIGIGLAMAREWQDARLRTPEEILTLLGMPVLATVPRINARLSPVARGQILYLDARSAISEAYRSVRTALHLGASREAKTILLASPMPGDGKSTTASNLAIAFAQAGHRTLLVDCDLREPVQHLIFETDAALGLSNVVSGEEKLRDAVRPTRVAGLYLLPCGPVPSNPSELLASKRFSQLMRALVETFDRIVIDSPPLMTVADARILAASADATVLVLRMNQSMRKYGIMAVDSLERVGANVLGAVANDVPTTKADNYYGGSWQYASSAKRLMASAPSRLPDETAPVPARPVRRPAEEAFDIAEPDWSADGG